MQLKHGIHLAYCTNIHRGETWAENFAALERDCLRVRERVMAVEPHGFDGPFAIGLRLSDTASRELVKPDVLAEFRRWLDRNRCYVFTINGFPYGPFHGAKIKERSYWPDWTTPERLDYTRRLFTILAELLPPGCEGSVSTLPGSFKSFGVTEDGLRAIRRNLWECIDFIDQLSQTTGRVLHLGLEPEPLCLIENTAEVVAFFDQLAKERPGDDRWRRLLGVTYDVCHFACEYEEPAASFAEFQCQGIRISKIHLSSAVRVEPTLAVRKALRPFANDVYLHQVIARNADGHLRRFRDLGEAFKTPVDTEKVEWRVHFHVPLHMETTGGDELFETTSQANRQVFDLLAAQPTLCHHLEMETYTWSILPPALRSRDVAVQLASEYAWCLANLERCGLR